MEKLKGYSNMHPEFLTTVNHKGIFQEKKYTVCLFSPRKQFWRE